MVDLFDRAAITHLARLHQLVHTNFEKFKTAKAADDANFIAAKIIEDTSDSAEIAKIFVEFCRKHNGHEPLETAAASKVLRKDMFSYINVTLYYVGKKDIDERTSSMRQRKATAAAPEKRAEKKRTQRQ